MDYSVYWLVVKDNHFFMARSTSDAKDGGRCIGEQFGLNHYWQVVIPWTLVHKPLLMIESMAMDLYGSELEIEDQLWQNLLYQVLTKDVIKTLNTKLQQLANSVTG